MGHEFTAKDVHVDNERSLVRVRWGDGRESAIPVTRLRGYCPCAECQGHGGDLRYIENQARGIDHAEPVGRYAILFRFDDGHTTGIYRWDFLRKLDPEEQHRWGEPERTMAGGG